MLVGASRKWQARWRQTLVQLYRQSKMNEIQFRVSHVGKQFELFGKCSESVQTPSLTALHTICCLLSDDVIRGEFVEGFDLFVVRNGCSCRWNSCSAICIPPLSTRRTAPTDLGLAAC